MRYKKLGIIALCILALLTIAGYGVGNYFYQLALNPLTDKSMVFEAEHNRSDGLASEDDWFQSKSPESMTLESNDGLQLHAFFIRNEEPTHKYAILAHGYTGSANGMTGYAKPFYTEGYNLLIPDARGHGESEGNYIGMGWHERLDMVQWIDTLIAEDPEAEIVLFGVSMGAATVLNTSGETLPDNVKAIVADCGYTSVYEIFAYQLRELFNLPSFPVMNLASLVTRLKAGYTLQEAAPIHQVAKSVTPILFIHGTDDTFVPYEMLDELYEAANVEKQRLTIEGAGHGGAATVNPELYWETVFNFLQGKLS